MQREGYVKETALTVRDWTFENIPFREIYYYMKYTNEPSVKSAMSWGCYLVDEFQDDQSEITKVYAITREEWLKTNTGKTYQEAIDAYYQILEDKKKGKTVIVLLFDKMFHVDRTPESS